MKRSMLVLLTAAAVMLGLATSVSAQQSPVTPGAPCSPEGATGRTADGTTVFCTRSAGEDQPRWRVATTQETQAPVATTTPAAAAQTTQTTAAAATDTMPRTGKASGESALIGFGAVLLGMLAVWWARPRLAAFFGGQRVIEQDRVDRASQLLGWSDPWENHLNKPHWLRHPDDD